MSICDPEEGMHAIFTNYLNKNFIADIPTTKNLEKKLEKNDIKTKKTKLARKS